MVNFTQDTEETPVLFRMPRKERVKDSVTGKWEWWQDGVIALFPAEAFGQSGDTCSCYVHVGQHGEADPLLVMRKSRQATPEEYADLKRELESAPYGYRLRVYQRLKHSFAKSRRSQLRRIKESA